VHYPEVLTAFIEVAIGIAGFSSIVVVLSRDRLTVEAKGVFSQLWMQSFGIIMFSALPLVLVGQMSDDPNWAYVTSSLAFACYLIVALPIAVYARRRITGEPLRPSAWPLLSMLPILSLINYFIVGEAWLYIGVLALGITIAFASFYRMVIGLFSNESGDA
jgi:hypothetical protein